ncbi:MAG: sensor histidine kinase [Marinifilaceae bacterium]
MKQRILQVLFFIPFILLSTASFSQLSKDDPRLVKMYWNFLRAKILPPNTYAARFEKDIKVQLKGNVTDGDSLCVRNLIVELRGLISTVDIELTDSVGNIVLDIDNPANKGMLTSSSFDAGPKGAIVSRGYVLNFINGESQDARNKHLTYYLLRGLTQKKHNSNGDTGIVCSVFQEKDPEKSSFTAVDRFIIEKLYSPDFYEQFKKSFYGSPIEYLYYRYGNRVKNISEMVGVFLGLLLFLVLLRLKIFTIESRGWRAFIKQGMLVAQCGYVFYYIAHSFIPTLLFSWTRWFLLIMELEILLFVVLNGLYLLEYVVFKYLERISLRLLLQFLSTVLFAELFFVLFRFFSVMLVTNGSSRIWELCVGMEEIVIILSTAGLRVVFNYVNYNNIQEIRKKDIELSQLKLLKTKAELQALHSRINPHFLYNSLNSIATLAYIDPKKTEQMALALSDFFRYAINRKDQDMIEISKEVEMANTYLQIEQVRFGDDLEFAIELEDGLEAYLIPRFLIQPLIENAVKHGVAAIQEKGEIKLKIFKTNNFLNVCVFDNGPDFPDTPISGYGLQSLYEKLNILYGELAMIKWENTPKKNFCISIPLVQRTF